MAKKPFRGSSRKKNSPRKSAAQTGKVQKQSVGIYKAADHAEKGAHAVHTKIKTTEAPVEDAERQVELSKKPTKPFLIVGIGASAGGYEAFSQLLETISSDTGMAFILVQHLDPTHESKLSELLSHVTRMPVVEIQNETLVEPNHVYIIPPARFLTISEGMLHLRPRRRGDGTNLPVDQFFESLALDQANRAIGVVLSGNGMDGTVGLKQIKAEGGITFVQDEHSAKFYGMPGSALHAGCVDFVLAPPAIARELERISAIRPCAVKNGQSRTCAAGDGNRTGQNFRPFTRSHRRGFLLLQTDHSQAAHHPPDGPEEN